MSARSLEELRAQVAAELDRAEWWLAANDVARGPLEMAINVRRACLARIDAEIKARETKP